MNIRSFKGFKNLVLPVIIASTPIITPINVKGANLLENSDTFVKNVVPVTGTSDSVVLAGAPNPIVTIAQKNEKAVFVVDVSKNILYHYDENGKAIKAYLIASGSEITPTHTGVRRISHTETFPYKSAPLNSKRRRNPLDYGPKIIILDKVDPKTGKISSTGEFIHGNRSSATLGEYVSHGCMRMDNDVIKFLASIVKRGQYVKIIR